VAKQPVSRASTLLTYLRLLTALISLRRQGQRGNHLPPLKPAQKAAIQRIELMKRQNRKVALKIRDWPDVPMLHIGGYLP
jgi:hypothetical protein